MSGGHYEYNQYKINYIADAMRQDIARCRKGWERYRYGEKILAEMVVAYNELREIAAKVHRIDWVLSGDDGEDDYFEQLDKDMSEIEYDDPARDDAWVGTPDEWDLE